MMSLFKKQRPHGFKCVFSHSHSIQYIEFKNIYIIIKYYYMKRIDKNISYIYIINS